MKRFFAFSFAALLLSACGDDATTKFTAASGTISLATVTAKVSDLTTGAQLNFTSAPQGSPSSVRREDSTFSSCTTKSPTTEVDADSDNVKTQTRTYACKDITLAGHTGLTFNQNGTVTVTDKDDSDAKSGWKYSYDMSGGHNTASTGASETYDYRGFWELVKDATSYTYSSDYKGTSSNTDRATTKTYVGGGTWSHKVTPTDMTDPYAKGGTMEFSGFYAYTFDVDSVPTQYVFKMSSTGLKYGATPCTNFFSEGSYTYTDAAANTITVTHTSCTARTVKYNTTAIP